MQCDGSCRARKGLCACGALKDGILQDGHSLHVSLMLKDGATIPGDRKDLAMMTDSEVRTMRDSVCGMPIDQAEKLPIYDDFRGFQSSGMNGARYAAMCDGADCSKVEYTADQDRRDAHYDHMKDRIGNAWKDVPVNDNRAITAPAGSDPDVAHREMVDRLTNGWRK